MTRLYDYWRSSASYRVRIALGLAGEAFDTDVINLLEQDHRSPTHLARNPQGLVPVLDIDGLTLTQSLAQIEYLNETREMGLLPDDAHGRAKVRALSYVIAMETHPVCNLSVAKWATTQSDGHIATTDWMQHFIGNGLRSFEQMASGPQYSYGTRVSLADICLMPQLYNADRWGVPLDEFPKIAAIKSYLETLPAFQKAYPTDPDA